MCIYDLETNITDNSAKEFASELLAELKKYKEKFSTHAMSDRTIFLQGKLEMLSEIIGYIQYIKP